MSELSEARKASARSTGVADHVLDSSGEDVVARVRAVTGGRGADVAFEYSSFDAVLDTPLDAVRPGAVVVKVSIWGHPATVDVQTMVLEELDLRGTIARGGPYCGTAITPRELTVAAQIVENLNAVIKTKAHLWGLTFVPVQRWFRGLDACGPNTAIYPPLPPGTAPAASEDPEGALHPNAAGQAIYARAIVKRIHR